MALQEQQRFEEARPLLEQLLSIRSVRRLNWPPCAACAPLTSTPAMIVRPCEMAVTLNVLEKRSLKYEGACGALQAERGVVSVRDTVQLVQLELAVGTPDALLRARNLAAACAEQVHSPCIVCRRCSMPAHGGCAGPGRCTDLCTQVSQIWQRYEDLARPQRGWFAKAPSAEARQKAGFLLFPSYARSALLCGLEVLSGRFFEVQAS